MTALAIYDEKVCRKGQECQVDEELWVPDPFQFTLKWILILLTMEEKNPIYIPPLP